MIDSSTYRDLNPGQCCQFSEKLAPCIGKPIIHHSPHLKLDLVCHVKDQGVRFTHSRDQNVSASNQEAVEHTKSTGLPQPIGAFPLHTIDPAYHGGANRFVNAYTLLDTLHNMDSTYIDVSKRPYWIDTRCGERVESPIVSYDAVGNLDFRWMCAFLDNGKPLTEHWNEQTQTVTNTVSDRMSTLPIKVNLKKGDIVVVNNRMLHAREGFENHPEHPLCWLLDS